MSSRLVEMINATAACGLEVVGVAPQGQSGGAAFVCWPDGRESVVTTGLTSLEHMRLTADVLDEVRESGIPVPRHELLLPIDDGTVAVVQERLPGQVVVESDASVVDAIVAMNERFAHLLADRPDVPAPPSRLGQPSWHEPLEQHSARSRRLSRLIEDVEPLAMTGDDLVQVDLTVPNFLFDDGVITGVIDWNYGVARGDRRFGLVKLLFDLTWAAAAPGDEQRPKPEALDRVNEVVHDVIEPSTLRRYWADHTLNMLYWTIRSGHQGPIDIHLGLGEKGL